MFLGLQLGFDIGVARNPLAPANTVSPVASGTASVGGTLSVTNGTWTNTPLSYAYQWRRNGAAISGETASSYVVVSGDLGFDITCTVTATNASGSGTATSNAMTISAGSGLGSVNLDEDGNPIGLVFF